MKHPSRWPWLLRFPLWFVAVVTVWLGPLALVFYGLSHLLRGAELGVLLEFVLYVGIMFAWSTFIMRVLVHPIIEPFFNIQSMQNKRHELFTPEPVHSFRDWLRLMFRGR